MRIHRRIILHSCIALFFGILAAPACNDDGDTSGAAKNNEESGEASGTEGSNTSSTNENADLTWIEIPAGTFAMGAEDDRTYHSSRPIHEVNVSGFEMTRSEITVNQYRECVDAAQCSEPGTNAGTNWNAPGYENHPVNMVSWNQAVAY